MGIDHLVLATMLRSGENFREIQASIPDSVFSVCLLKAATTTLESRLRSRHVGSDLEGHLQDSTRFAEFLDQAGFEDFAVANEGQSVPDLASWIIERVSWLGHTSQVLEPSRVDITLASSVRGSPDAPGSPLGAPQPLKASTRRATARYRRSRSADHSPVAAPSPRVVASRRRASPMTITGRRSRSASVSGFTSA